MSERADLLAEIDRCVRCGTCQAHCPVYQLDRREGMVARGRIYLAGARAREHLPAGGPLAEYLSSCLLCGRCQAGCPNEVDTPRLVRLARGLHLAGAARGRLRRWLLARLLPAGRRLERMFGLARRLRPLWARRLPGDSGLRLRLANPRRGPRRWLPEPARPILQRRQLPRAFTGPGPKVALFPGCVANFLDPAQGLAAVEVLQGLGAQVAVARELGCCGLVALGGGDTTTARRLAARNLELLWPREGPEPDFVTSQCGSCAYMLKKHLPQLLADRPEVSGRARELAEKVIPFSMLADKLGFGGASRETAATADGAETDSRTTITWHDPCHLAVGLGVREQPRKILTSLDGAIFREADGGDKCCGNGGLFTLAHPDLSFQIAEKKLAGIRETGANAIITECSGCYLQLSWLVTAGGLDMEVLSLAEAILCFSTDKK